jgi:glycosyltransferase involved in cell wall biosynthesis
MRIAIVAPHPVPFGLGGAEGLIWGLQDHLNEKTEHDCEIVNLVSPERTLAEVVASYEAFTHLDLGRFDCVISGKYPAWMVNHDNHVVYMLHRLRGLYDTYPFAEDARHAAFGEVPVRALRDFMRGTSAAGTTLQDVREFFPRFDALRTSTLPDELFAHPGPLGREIVHWLDGYALSPGRIRSYAAIADTVRRRKDYFPDGVHVDVLYPPANGSNYHTGGGDYFFTCSRLDGPKRVGLIVEAMRHVTADIPLLIAGTGPAEAELKAKAAGDPRIRFLGFVPDEALPGHYADALAVPFVPYDEDYGLITIEAMKSGKPVVTTLDAGGPREFVTDGETGYATAPDPEALGAALQALASDPAGARAMGRKAAARVADISLDSVVHGLLDRPKPALAARASGRKAGGARGKLTVAATFPVHPPRGGGQLRVFHLYRNIAREHDVDLVTLAPAGERYEETTIAPGLKEIRVPRSEAHDLFERDLLKAMNRTPIADVAAARLAELTPDLGAALRYSASDADAVVACHPYLLPAIMKAAPGTPLWYEAQDVEHDLKAGAYRDSADGSRLLAEVDRVEKMAWTLCDVAFACAERDLDRLTALYGPTRAETLEVPNGVDLGEVAYTTYGERIAGRAGGRTRLALFIGSWHPPNIDAIELIIEIAPTFPDVAFLVAGTACLPFEKRAMPENVRLLGLVDNATRAALFATADLALNPMRFGSGTNLKMLDYFAAGIPVVTTRFGMRGLAVTAGRHVTESPDDDFAAGLRDALAAGDDVLEAMSIEARDLAETRYSWEAIAADFLSRVGARLG